MVAELLDVWLGQTVLSPSTRLDYRRAIGNHIASTPLAKMPVWKVRTFELDALYGALTAKGLGSARVKRVHNILRCALGQAVRWQWIARNPAMDASPPPVRRTRIVPPGPSGVAHLLASAAPDLQTYLLLSAHLGARRGEVCALQWADIDLRQGELTIRRALVDGGPGVGVVAKDTKTHQDRTVAISPTVPPSQSQTAP